MRTARNVRPAKEVETQSIYVALQKLTRGVRVVGRCVCVSFLRVRTEEVEGKQNEEEKTIDDKGMGPQHNERKKKTNTGRKGARL